MFSSHLILVLIVMVIVAAVLIWGTRRILKAFGIGDPYATLIYVLVVFLCMFTVIDQTGILGTRLISG